MQRPVNLLEMQLLKARQRVVWLVVGAYILYLLLTSLIDPPGSFPLAYQYAKYSVGALALIVLTATMLFKHRVVFAAMAGFAALVPICVLEVERALRQGLLPYDSALWMTCGIALAFVLLGSRWGMVFTNGMLLLTLATMLAVPPRSPALLSAWLTGMLVVGVLAAICYTVTRFIESNLVLHQQDHAKLQAARLDALTGVPGRAAIEEELVRSLEYARKSGTPLSLLVGDIDHFKQVNDRHGHATGDDVLRAVAKRLRRNLGGTGGTVGRWGGEEFIILLPGLAKPDAVVMAERLRREVSDAKVAGLNITTSFGVASYRGASDTPEQLFGRADQALYEAKRAGRNAVR